MPFGLCNAPSTFQRLMEQMFGDQHYQSTLLYLDDVIVFSSTVDEHLSRLDLVLWRFQKEGLKVKLEKCNFLQQQVQYLGHVVSASARAFNPAEKNYSPMKLEFLGMKWAMAQKLSEYLLGHKCVVWTDNNPLSHLNTAKLGATEQR